MEKNELIAKRAQAPVPQLRLRTDLRGGESVESCSNNLKVWQDNYYKQYNTVNQTKPTPCNYL